MKFKATLMYMGNEQHVNKEGEPYWKVLFVDGVDPLNVITRDEKILACEPYKPYNCTFVYNPKYESLRLDSVEPLK